MPIFDQSEAEKLSQIHTHTDRYKINILLGPPLRAAPAKIKKISKITKITKNSKITKIFREISRDLNLFHFSLSHLPLELETLDHLFKYIEMISSCHGDLKILIASCNFCPDQNDTFPKIPPDRNCGWIRMFFELRGSRYLIGKKEIGGKWLNFWHLTKMFAD